MRQSAASRTIVRHPDLSSADRSDTNLPLGFQLQTAARTAAQFDQRCTLETKHALIYTANRKII